MIYVFHGPDEFSIDQAVRDLKGKVGLPDLREPNTSAFDWNGLQLGQLVSTASAVPFLAERRLVIVNGLLSHIDRGEVDPKKRWSGLGTAMQTLPDSTDVVFVEKDSLREKGAALRLLGPIAQVQRFDLPRRERLQAWIRDRVLELGSEIDSAAASRLGWLAGTNLRLLDQEIRKLALFARDRTIVRADVDALVANAREENVFAAVDAVLDKRLGVAVRSLYMLLSTGTGISTIISLLARQTRLTMIARDLLDAGVTGHDDIADRLGVRHRFVVEKTLRQASKFDTRHMARLHRRLLKADLVGKTGQMDERLNLELLVARLCEAD